MMEIIKKRAIDFLFPMVSFCLGTFLYYHFHDPSPERAIIPLANICSVCIYFFISFSVSDYSAAHRNKDSTT